MPQHIHRSHPAAPVRPATILLSALLILAPVLCPLTAAQVTGEDLPGYSLADAERLLQASLALFHSSRQDESIPGFSDILDTIRLSTPAEELSDTERRLLITCYEHRARALFNKGDSVEAGHDLRSLLSLEPGFQLDPDQVSPKIVQLFNSVRDDLIGSLAVSAIPPSSTLIVDGVVRGVTDGTPVYLFAGSHRVEVRRPGFDQHLEIVDLPAGKQLELGPVELIRTMATCKFITVPAGVSVYIDGELAGVTGNRPSAEARQAARVARLNPLDVSEFLLVPDIAPGTHQVEFRKECRVTVSRELNFGQPIDYVDNVRQLAPSEGSIAVRAVPTGCTIYLDGKNMGIGDQLLERVCSGEHRIDAAFRGGRFSTNVQVVNGGRVAVTTELRPTLAYVGTFPRIGLGGGSSDQDLAMVRQGLVGVRSLNLSFPETAAVDKLFQSFGLPPGQALPDEIPLELLASLGRTLECNLVLLAVREGGDGELRLYSTLHPAPERIAAGQGGLSSVLPRLATLLDASPALSRPWTGLLVADVPLATGFPAIGVTPGSPAADAGIHMGDVVSSVEGSRLTGAAMFRQTVDNTGPGGTLAIKLNRDGRLTPVSLQVASTPILLPISSNRFLYNRMLETLSSRLNTTDPGGNEAAEIRLNMAICLLRFGQSERAAGILEAAATTRTAGISRGTISYYLARCAADTGRIDRAERLYAEVINHPESTLVDHEGPPAWIAVTGLFSDRSAEGQPAP